MINLGAAISTMASPVGGLGAQTGSVWRATHAPNSYWYPCITSSTAGTEREAPAPITMDRALALVDEGR